LKRLQGGATNVHAVLEERQRRKNSKEMYYAAVSGSAHFLFHRLTIFTMPIG